MLRYLRGSHMVRGFANLSDELQQMVVERLLFSEVMEICQTSRTIRRQDRCRHLIRHWLRKNIPDAFTPGSPYVDGGSPTKWIKTYTEAQIEPVVVVFKDIIRLLHMVQFGHEATVQAVNEWLQKKVDLERLPIRAAMNYTMLLRSMIDIQEWIDKDISGIKSQVPRSGYGLLITLFLVVCGHSQTLRDMMPYNNEKWRALVLKYAYQDAASIHFFIVPRLPPTFLWTLLGSSPFEADDISPRLAGLDYPWLLRNGLITISWDSITTLLARATRTGESRLLDALRASLQRKLPHTTAMDAAQQATLESGLVRSRSWPALRRMLSDVVDLNRRYTEGENQLRKKLSLVGSHQNVKMLRVFEFLVKRKFAQAQAPTPAERSYCEFIIVTAARSFVNPGGNAQAAFEVHALRALEAHVPRVFSQRPRPP